MPVGHTEVTSRMHQDDCTNIAQPNIPITTAPPHKYSQNLSPIFFFHKNNFSTFFGALSRGYCPQFSSSPSHATCPQIFSHLSTSILTSFFTVFNLLMIILPPHDRQSQTGVTNLWAVTHTWPLFFLPHPYTYREAVNTYLQRNPYAFTSTATPTPKTD